MDDSKNLKWGVFFSYITIVVNIVVSLLYTPFLLHMLGQQQYGLYNMGQAAVSYLSLTEFGLGNAAIRYLASCRAKKDKGELEKVLGLFLFIYGLLALVVLLAGTLICAFSDRFYTVSTGAKGYRELKVIIMIMTINLSCNFFLHPYSSVVVTYEKYIFAKATNLIYIFLKPMVMVPILLLGHGAIALSVVTLVLTVGLSLTNLIYVRCVLKIRPDMSRRRVDMGVLKEIAGYSFFIFLGTIVAQLNNNTDNIILGSIAGETMVAIYSMGALVSSYALQIPGTVTSVLFPRVTVRIKSGASMAEMSSMMLRVGRIQFYVAFLLGSGVVLFGTEFIQLWVGEGYQDSYWITLSLLIPNLIFVVQGLMVQILQAMNRYRFCALLNLACAILNVVSSIPAAIRFGPLGCAVCTAATTLLCGVILNWRTARTIELSIADFWKNMGKLLIACSPTVIVGLALRLITQSGWVVFFLEISVYSIVFALYAYAVCMNKEERELVCGIVHRFLPSGNKKRA